jgi:hypothetical protein
MRDDRAVSITINYVLGLAIAFVLVIGLLFAGGNFIEDQRENAIRAELAVLGEQVGADLLRADRLAATTTENETVRLRRRLPNTVAGTSYTIGIRGGRDPVLVLNASSGVTVRVEMANQTAVERSRVLGGPVAITYTDSDALVLEDGDG